MEPWNSIHASFEAVAERSPQHVAVVDDDQHLTYGELAQRSDAIAAYLCLQGVARGDRVGLFAQRSLAAVAAMLGILKAGATYVPFDPSYPPKLLRFVYEDCSPHLMLTQASLSLGGDTAFWAGNSHDLQMVFSCNADMRESKPLPRVGADDPAYIMYTSGSTGRPKGVLIPHRGVVRLVTDNTYAEMGPTEVHLLLAPLAFDASTFEIWGALLNGATLAVLPASHPSLDEVASSIRRHRVTTLWLTAGLFHLMIDHRLDGLRPLKQLLAGGDVLSPVHVAKAQLALPGCQIINGYGPTENTTFTCCYRIPRNAAACAAIPIGTPINHTQVYILDESRRPVDSGQEGELFAGGDGLGLAYWNRPELTAERFIVNPFDSTGTTKLYRSGDRVRRRADGNMEFLGRIDRQVKLNGKRVELDEIEACIRRSPAVVDAAVICPEADVGARQVHAYVKFRTDAASALSELRLFLKQELPDYMVPASVTSLLELPLSPTGKVDRSRLPLPSRPSAGLSPPLERSASNTTGAIVSAIWRQILRRDSIALDDNFFDLGGTSLQLIAVHAKITESMQTDITVVDLFQYPSIAALTARLRRGIDAPGAVAPGAAAPGLNVEERARRQQIALARARTNMQRNVR